MGHLSSWPSSFIAMVPPITKLFVQLGDMGDRRKVGKEGEGLRHWLAPAANPDQPQFS
jgi:hypothetical protein